ncbi:hypothetical protein GCM10017687_16290 [Streptomyces echinatus]
MNPIWNRRGPGRRPVETVALIGEERQVPVAFCPAPLFGELLESSPDDVKERSAAKDISSPSAAVQVPTMRSAGTVDLFSAPQAATSSRGSSRTAVQRAGRGGALNTVSS